MSRLVVLFAQPPTAGAAPPGVDAEAFAQAVVEDAYEAVAALAGVDVCVAVPLAAGARWRELVGALLWPGTPLVEVTGPVQVLEDDVPIGGASGDSAVLVAADAPDLPDLVLASVFSALDTVAVAAAPALRGGLVALGWRRPAPDWLRSAGVELDPVDAVEHLRAAAPDGGLEITRPWRRLREPTDVASLDPGLEGWDATRSLLGGSGASRR